MAEGMKFAGKDKAIDDLTDDFKRKLDEFASEVKKRMRTTSPADAFIVFNMTFAFFTMFRFPDVSKLGAVTHAEEDETARPKKDVKKPKKSKAKPEANFESKIRRVDTDLDKTPQTTAAATHISGLASQTTRAATPTFGMNFTSAAATPTSGMNFTSAAAPPRGLPKSLRDRTSFSTILSSDVEDPQIEDLKLLPGCLVLLADFQNSCVKLFNTQGQHLHSLVVASPPRRLAVMDSTSSCGGDVAITLPKKSQIAMLLVTQNGLSLKRSIKAPKKYEAIAAVDAETLAVGYWGGPGIDLIDLSGNILRQLSSPLWPRHMVTTPDQCLVMSLKGNKIAKLKLEDKTVLYDDKVGQVTYPWGIACHKDGSCLIVDQVTRTLHLVSTDGVYAPQLWSHPGGRDSRDRLCCVSVLGDECLGCTKQGIAFLTDVLY